MAMSEDQSDYQKALAAGRKVIEDGAKPQIKLSAEEEAKARHEETDSPLKHVDPVQSDSLTKFRKQQSEPTEVPVDSGFEPLLRDHLTQPASDADKRPTIMKRTEKGTQVPR
jgi:hypothetical protein